MKVGQRHSKRGSETVRPYNMVRDAFDSDNDSQDRSHGIYSNTRTKARHNASNTSSTLLSPRGKGNHGAGNDKNNNSRYFDTPQETIDHTAKYSFAMPSKTDQARKMTLDPRNASVQQASSDSSKANLKSNSRHFNHVAGS